MRDSGQFASMDVKPQRTIQSFCSSDLKRRTFVVQKNDGRYKVIYQVHSDKVINIRGDVEGWQTQPEKPVSDTLAGAVEIARNWAHANDE
jgi:hypothetical protein